MRKPIAAALLTVATSCAELQRSDGAPLSGGAAGASASWRADDVETFIDGWGRVRSSPEVLANFPQALLAAPESNRTVEPCRRAVEAASSHNRPAVVQAAALGPESRTRSGLYVGAVEVRVLYVLSGVRVVRQATMRCITQADGAFVNAEVLQTLPTDQGSGANVVNQTRVDPVMAPDDVY